jgi:hypothetical protein
MNFYPLKRHKVNSLGSAHPTLLTQTLQNAIETRERTVIRAWVDGFLPTAPLMAAEDVFGQLERIGTNTAIGHNGLVENDTSSSNIEIEHFDSSEINTSEFAIARSTFFQFGSSEDSISDYRFKNTRLEENSVSKVSSLIINSLARTFSEISLSEVGEAHIAVQNGGVTENGTSKINTSENSTTKILVGKSALTHIGSREISFFDNDFTSANFFITELQSRQVESSKVSLPSIVSIQQLNSSNLSHDNTSLLTSIYSTAQSIWQTTTPINLNFAITNLPTGQLAEATITGYDTYGRPNTATITLDDDGNGLCWFIDTTPQDNSEFRAGSGGDYFTANPDSQAYGKYDLLTTILHEMGHTLGIIKGYSEFDKYVRNNKFVTASGTEITLTPDGSHLDPTFHPYDLMNTRLKTGIRKLPSAMDWAIIDALNSGVGSRVSGVGTITAPLTAGALLALTNGDFTTTTGWNIEGATNILNGTATLTAELVGWAMPRLLTLCLFRG